MRCTGPELPAAGMVMRSGTPGLRPDAAAAARRGLGAGGRRTVLPAWLGSSVSAAMSEPTVGALTCSGSFDRPIDSSPGASQAAAAPGERG